MKNVGLVVNVYIDERRNPFRLGCLVCTDRESERLFTQTLKALKKQHKLTLHAHNDAKDKHKQSAVKAVCASIQASLSDALSFYVEFGGSEINAYQAMLSFLKGKYARASIRIYSDITSQPHSIRALLQKTINEHRWRYEFYEKNMTPTLISAVDYILYFDLA